MRRLLINIFVMNYLFYKLQQNVNKKTLMLQSFCEHKNFATSKILQIHGINYIKPHDSIYSYHMEGNIVLYGKLKIHIFYK